MAYWCRIIPESFKKKSERDAKIQKSRADARAAAKTARAEKRKVYLANAEKYEKEYTAEEQRIIKAKRDAKAQGNYYVEAQPKVALVIRTRG